MTSNQTTTAQPVLGNISPPREGHIALVQLIECPDGSLAYHINHIETAEKTNKELKKEVRAYMYGKLSAIGRVWLQIRGHSLTAQVMRMGLQKIHDPITWDKKTVLEVLSPASATGVDPATMQGHDLRAQVDTIIAGGGSSLNADTVRGIAETRLVLLVKKTRMGKPYGPQIDWKEEPSLQLAEIPDPGARVAKMAMYVEEFNALCKAGSKPTPSMVGIRN